MTEPGSIASGVAPIVVVNPQAGRGGGGARAREVRDAAARWFGAPDVRLTRGPGDAARWAAEAVADGRDVVAVGGDGTAREVLCGVGACGRSETVVGVVPLGTGNDLARGLGLPTSLDEAMSVARHGRATAIDLMRLGDAPALACNVVGFGINGAVVRSVAASGGSYLGATVRSWVSHRPAQVQARWEGPDGDGEWNGELLAGFLANGPYCGGGMWVGKDGAHGDGWVELTLVPPASPLRLPGLVRALYDGGLAAQPGVVRTRVRLFEVFARRVDRVPVDVDGDVGAPLPLTVAVSPQAVRVRVPDR